MEIPSVIIIVIDDRSEMPGGLHRELDLFVDRRRRFSVFPDFRHGPDVVVSTCRPSTRRQPLRTENKLLELRYSETLYLKREDELAT